MYKIQNDSKSFDKTHEIKKLYDDLTNEDRNNIEGHFTKLMTDCPFKYPDRLGSIKEFASRFNTSYQFWCYDIIKSNANHE